MAISSLVGALSAATESTSMAAQTAAQTASFTAAKEVNNLSTSDFASKMATSSNKELTTLLSTPGVSDERKSEIAGELLKRLEAAKAAAGTGGTPTDETDEEDKLKELLKKLMEGKKMTSDEMNTLTGLLAKNKTANDETKGGSSTTDQTV